MNLNPPGSLRLTISVVLAAIVLSASPTALATNADPADPPPAASTSRLHVILVNGGGTARMNYQSHLLHLKQLRSLLIGAGVDADRITVFNADGEDPGEDVALRKGNAEDDFWRLRGTKAFGTLRVPIIYESSSIEGEELRAATQAEIGKWFETEGSKIPAGDTLLVYVTDHGNKNDTDLRNNTIRLWGKDEEQRAEALSVAELREMLGHLDADVRVVALMSQCFSGSFANLVEIGDVSNLPNDRVCGYFSTTADRKAYGCYPQNMGVDNLGHSFRLIHALAQGGSFAAAHDDILTTDTTPDVPLKTSDMFLDELLGRVAKADNEELEAFTDALLAEAWKDKAAWEPEIRLLDRIGAAFGLFSPRSLAEFAEQSSALLGVAGRLESVSDAWKATLTDSNAGNFARFIEEQPKWSERLDKAAKDKIEQAEARAMSKELLRDLGKFTRKDRETDERVSTLHENSKDASSMSYRMEVRAGVLSRMRTILLRVAGRHYLATRSPQAERAAYEALTRCEDLRVPPRPDLITALAEPDSFPPYVDDVATATAALPAWMGIRFRDVEPAVREKLDLEAGATRILHVYPDSPAAKAGLETGDILLGPPGRPFTEPKRIRSWTMLSKIHKNVRLDILRDEEPHQLALLPGEYPLEWPELPGPPEIGEDAPPLKLSLYRGENDGPAAAGPQLLFFWATWCGPCKLAIPDLLAFERKLGAPVIAITDEASEQLDAFFEKHQAEFPSNVAIDPLRQTFLNYGVSGTPTFVYIDEDGKVQSHRVGYDKTKRLGETVMALMASKKD